MVVHMNFFCVEVRNNDFCKDGTVIKNIVMFLICRCRSLRKGLVCVHGEHGRRHGQADDDGQQEPEHRCDADERSQLQKSRHL